MHFDKIKIQRLQFVSWCVLYCAASGRTKERALVEQLVWTLRHWPLELVMWQTTNSHRLDISFNPEQDRYVLALIYSFVVVNTHGLL